MSWIWIAFIILIILLIAGTGSKGNRNRQTKPHRIDHPHYITDDESECSVCGARFSKKLASCPRCGTQFDSAETDEEEWYEEFDEECAWDEEEGR
jgi:predicted amidophosphoribosyltransferase